MKKVLQYYFAKRFPDNWTKKHIEIVSERAYGTAVCNSAAFILIALCASILLSCVFVWANNFLRLSTSRQVNGLIALYAICTLLMTLVLCIGGD